MLIVFFFKIISMQKGVLQYTAYGKNTHTDNIHTLHFGYPKTSTRNNIERSRRVLESFHSKNNKKIALRALILQKHVRR